MEEILIGILDIHGKDVSILAGPHIAMHAHMLLSTVNPLTSWASNVSPAIDVTSIHVTDVDMFGKKIGFVKFKVDCSTNGWNPPSIVFARGGAISILPIFRYKDASKVVHRVVVLTCQPRIPAGMEEMLELPAGMLDGDYNFAGVAAKELEEEVGEKIAASDLFDLTAIAYNMRCATLDMDDRTSAIRSILGLPLVHESIGKQRGMFPSPGGCDEFIRLYAFEKFVTEDFVVKLKARKTGNLKENERITLKVVPLEDLWFSTTDSKALASYALLRELEYLGLDMLRM